MERRHPAFDLEVHELGPDDPRSAQPSETNPSCKVHLKPHQLTLLQRCLDFEHGKFALRSRSNDDYLHTSVGIIGDKMGAGKSYVVLSIVNNQSSLEENKQYKLQTFGNNKVALHILDTHAICNTSVLIVPHILCNQWKDYIDAYSDDFKYTIITNMKSLEPFRKNANLIATSNLIVLSANMHNSLANLLIIHKMKVMRVIYDEVDSMNLPNTLEIPTRFYWFVTASYGNLLYPRGFRTLDSRAMRYVYHATGLKNNGYVRNLFIDLVSMRREFLNMLVCKNRDSFVDESFMMMAPLVRIIRCKEPGMLGILNGLVDRNVMECLNAGDVRSAIELIDTRQRHSEKGIINILINKYRDDLHNLNIQFQSVTVMNYINPSDKTLRLTRLEERISEITRKVNSIGERVTTTMMCPVCYDDIENKSITPCGHSFCFKCIHVWINLNSSCPLCKASLSARDVFVARPKTPITNDENDTTNSFVVTNGDSNADAGTCESNDKIQNLMAILANRRTDSKFLVFSSYDVTFHRVAQRLESEPIINFSYLKGNKNHIKQKLLKYRTSNLDLLLVNSSNYGSGLNLENTTDIVMFHKCDSEIEKQVIGRAQRSGRTSQLNIWYLVHDNEIVQLPPGSAPDPIVL